MKRIAALICAFMTVTGAAFAAPVTTKPIYGGDLRDGTYEIGVDSSSSMFRVADCELTVRDGEMTALMTLSGTGYEKLFMGKGDEALSAAEDEFIYFEETPEGKYAYAVPVQALNTDIDCAAFSIRKQAWYDRTLVFKADTLPKEAFPSGKSLAAALAVVAVAAAAILICCVRKKKR